MLEVHCPAAVAQPNVRSPPLSLVAATRPLKEESGQQFAPAVPPLPPPRAVGTCTHAMHVESVAQAAQHASRFAALYPLGNFVARVGFVTSVWSIGFAHEGGGGGGAVAPCSQISYTGVDSNDDPAVVLFTSESGRPAPKSRSTTVNVVRSSNPCGPFGSMRSSDAESACTRMLPTTTSFRGVGVAPLTANATAKAQLFTNMPITRLLQMKMPQSYLNFYLANKAFSAGTFSCPCCIKTQQKSDSFCVSNCSVNRVFGGLSLKKEVPHGFLER